ncbi:MAG: response regulator [Bryobacterales bacterium]|nr:response regulator [Bryobacterales bacterium]
MDSAEPSRDPILLVGGNGQVISANLAFHAWLKTVSPQTAASDLSTWTTNAPDLGGGGRRRPRRGRGRPVRILLRSILDGAQLACAATVDGSPHEETYVVRLVMARADKDGLAAQAGRRPMGGVRRGAGRTYSVERGALQAIAAAARNLAGCSLDDWQREQVNEIQGNVNLLLQGSRRPRAASIGGVGLGGVISGELAMRENRDLRVLLVEDNPINRTVASHMLARLGLSPDICTNGHEAVERATAQTYDLILMDVQMPEMDGIEATYRIRELRSDRRPTRIVALTANTVDETRQACEKAGMDGFLAKPFTLAELNAMLNRLLERPLEPLTS